MGVFHPEPDDHVPDLSSGQVALSVVMVGNIGSGDFWPAFQGANEYLSAVPDPMDSWTKRIIEPIASGAGGEALFPSDGPPYHPFQRWASRGVGLFPSPIGLYISPMWGTWHALRAAIALPIRLELPVMNAEAVSPCLSCIEQPCLHTCPVDAFDVDKGYDYLACARHVASSDDTSCASKGCLARRACPIGQRYTLNDDHAAFHMAAFVNARKLLREI